MFEIKNNIIKITKGDSATLNIDLKNNDGKPYIMSEGDTLTLTVKKDLKNPSYLMKVVSNTTQMEFDREQTKNLVVGGLYYDIQLDTHDSKTYTVVGVTSNSFNFFVYSEVTE